MPSIRATDKDVLWAVGNPIVAAGITEIGGITITGLVMFSDTDEKAFLSKTNGKAGVFNPLPKIGEWIEKGIYGDKGNLIISKDTHTLKTEELKAVK